MTTIVQGLHAQVLRFVSWPRAARRTLVMFLDCAVCLVAVPLALWLRLGQWELLTPRVAILSVAVLASWIVATTLAHTYRSVSRFAGRYMVVALMRSCIMASVILAALLFSLRISNMPRTFAIIHPLILYLLLLGERSLVSQLVISALQGFSRDPSPTRVLIYGAGVSGQQLAASIHREPGIKVVGFADKNESLCGRTMEGKPIWHPCDLPRVLRAERVDEVYLALPSVQRSARRSAIEWIRQCKGDVHVRVLPSISQIARGRVSVSDLREVQIEELLGRDEVAPDPQLMERDIRGGRVLVTGAGGSIGSELCRQIIRHRPSLIVLAEQSEHGLYEIDIELREIAAAEGLEVLVVPELVNVADERHCNRIFKQHAIQTVFHAAAYKHVPLVETNPVAGIRNNICATLSTVRASERCGVRKYILVSTDKAVRPTNVMGASKRLCELIVQGRAAAQQPTSFCSVRFGNVLGSSGSVIPRFRRQIAAGGPVTVTHREATRYFMTIPEAAQLVIQAGALAAPGEVLLLDMGEPIRIMDLARLMIELSGLTVADEDNPDGDIAIQEVGLRPGEKLIEELLIGCEARPTPHPRIVTAREAMIEWKALEPELARLLRFIDAGDASAAIAILKQLVPEYRSDPALLMRPASLPASGILVPEALTSA